MRVFISWSGKSSRSVAEALADWFPKVLQNVEPFLSAKDIDKGANWTAVLADELERAEFGVVCLAPDNLASPWLNYETGAITKSVNSRVCPVLFQVEKSDVEPPIGQLQLTSLDIEDMSLLMASMNSAAGSPVSQEALRETVAVWWPRLEERIDKIAVPPASPLPAETLEPEKPVVDIAEMTQEVLHRVRNLDDRLQYLDDRVRRVEGGASRTTQHEHLTSRAIERLLTDLSNHGLDIDKASRKTRSVDVTLEGDLPDVFDPKAMAAAQQAANQMGLTVRVLGVNGLAEFRPDGTSFDAF